MARAIVHGAISADRLDPRLVVVADPSHAARAQFENSVPTARGAMAWLREHESEPGCGQVLLAVKPQSLGQVAGELTDADAVGERVVISILAGMPTERIRAMLGGRCRVVRVMPNTPARVGRGMSAIAGAGGEDRRLALDLMSALGEVIEIEQQQMDAFTAVAGSGPAYVFYLAEAMEAAARRLGFEQSQASAIVTQTIVGAATLLEAGDASAAELRASVTSRGGTTAAATDVLDHEGMTEMMVRAIRSARDRGAELAREA